MRGSVEDKSRFLLGGLPVWRHSFDCFAATGRFRRCVLVYRDAPQREAMEAALPPEAFAELCWAEGGAERGDSVRAGLAAFAARGEMVAIHDAARPLVHPAAVTATLDLAESDGAAVLARPVTDTIKRLPTATALRSVELEDLDRARLWAMETPQIFRGEWLVEAYAARAVQTDDAAVVGAAGYRVSLCASEHPNPKLTRPEDLAWLEFLLQRPPP